MAAQLRKGTGPELALRRILHARGYRYRIDFPIPNSRRRADIVFTRQKLMVFVDGCFWHSCPVHGSIPKQNREWWVAKLLANVARDHDTDARLRAAGWRVLRFWEHEEPVHAANRIGALLRPGAPLAA